MLAHRARRATGPDDDTAMARTVTLISDRARRVKALPCFAGARDARNRCLLVHLPRTFSPAIDLTTTIIGYDSPSRKETAMLDPSAAGRVPLE
ncbi:MAG: hypothetical protein WA191_08905, partial [Telluria sp.]